MLKLVHLNSIIVLNELALDTNMGPIIYFKDKFLMNSNFNWAHIRVDKNTLTVQFSFKTY